MSIIYTTYDVELKKYLSKLGIKHLICGRAVKNTEKLFWVYERNALLNNALNNWFHASN